MKRIVAVSVLVVLVFVSAFTVFFGSTFLTVPQSKTTSTSPTSSLTSAAVMSTTSSHSLSLAQKPLIWFAPQPAVVGGSLDFSALFTDAAPWAKAASHVQVFKFYGWKSVGGLTSDGELEQMISDLNRRGIAIALETGPLTETTTCGSGVEGFGGPEEGVGFVLRIKAAGGVVRFVDLDEPFFYGSLYSGPNACHWSREEIARQVATFVQAIKRVFPDVVVGDVEPLPTGMQVGDLKEWVSTYRIVTGSDLPYFHLDLDFSHPDWPEAAKELETFTRGRGIEFGIIYTGDYNDASDAEWVAHAEERMVTYEAKTGGRPDHVIFQSWQDHPDYCLPETDPTTFTYLINRYFRTRIKMSLSIGSSQDRSLEGYGVLSDAAALPLSGRSVELSLTPLDGPGQFAEYTTSGIVPKGAKEADVGFRVNTECGCASTSDFVLYNVRYIQGAETANRVPNGNFIRRLEGWGFWGNGSARLEKSDRGAGQMLHIIASSAESAAINSASFPVTPGETYTLRFAARVSPRSIGSGYFDIVFLAPPEITRETITLKPATISMATPRTDELGTYHFILKELLSGTFLLEAEFPGDDVHWPAYAAVTLSIHS